MLAYHTIFVLRVVRLQDDLLTRAVEALAKRAVVNHDNADLTVLQFRLLSHKHNRVIRYGGLHAVVPDANSKLCTGGHLAAWKLDAGSDVEARFQCGDEVIVYEVSSQWAKVAGGETGYVWCSVDYLSSNPPDSDPQTYAVHSNGRVRVRETPDGDLVRWLQDGDTVQVQSWFNGWAYIGDGYVLGQWPGGGLEAVE